MTSLCRLNAAATEAYKSYADKNSKYNNAMLNPSNKPYTFSGGSLAKQPKENTTPFGLDNLSYQAAKFWINLPYFIIKNTTSLTKFKSLLAK